MGGALLTMYTCHVQIEVIALAVPRRVQPYWLKQSRLQIGQLTRFTCQSNGLTCDKFFLVCSDVEYHQKKCYSHAGRLGGRTHCLALV